MLRPISRLRPPKVNLIAMVVILATAAAAEGALAMNAWMEVAGVSLAVFLVGEGSALVPVWAHHHRRARRERERAAELVAALTKPAYAARVAQTIRESEIMREQTVVLKVVPTAKKTVYSSVYAPRSHPLEDGLTVRMWDDLRDDGGDITSAA